MKAGAHVFSMEWRGAHRSIWSPCGAQFDEEFDEVLFSILAVDEQIPYLNLRTLVPVRTRIRSATSDVPLTVRSPFITFQRSSRAVIVRVTAQCSVRIGLRVNGPASRGNVMNQEGD